MESWRWCCCVSVCKRMCDFLLDPRMTWENQSQFRRDHISHSCLLRLHLLHRHQALNRSTFAFAGERWKLSYTHIQHTHTHTHTYRHSTHTVHKNYTSPVQTLSSDCAGAAARSGVKQEEMLLVWLINFIIDTLRRCCLTAACHGRRAAAASVQLLGSRLYVTYHCLMYDNRLEHASCFCNTWHLPLFGL